MNKVSILEQANCTNRDLEILALTWNSLQQIYDHYLTERPVLEDNAASLARSLTHCQSVHSIQARTKDPNSLIAKIIRKIGENRKRIITVENYQDEITDLIGIRVLHLYKLDWFDIDKYIRDYWYFLETEPPTLFHREGDNVALSFTDEQLELGYRTKVHSRQYRSVHYIILQQVNKQKTVKAEIQVRTVFEEAWSEIDHQLRYPLKNPPQVVGEYLGLLNRITGIADEMATNLQAISSEWAEFDRENHELQIQNNEFREKYEKLEQQISSDTIEKEQLLKELKELKTKHIQIVEKLNDIDSKKSIYHSYSTDDFAYQHSKLLQDQLSEISASWKTNAIALSNWNQVINQHQLSLINQAALNIEPIGLVEIASKPALYGLTNLAEYHIGFPVANDIIQELGKNLQSASSILGSPIDISVFRNTLAENSFSSIRDIVELSMDLNPLSLNQGLAHKSINNKGKDDHEQEEE